MRLLEFILLGIMITTGVCCSIKDIRYGIVPNRWILCAGISATLIQTVYIALYSVEYTPGWLLSMLFADSFALLLYASGIWAAGDVKLFFLLFLCVPGKLLDAGGLVYSVIPYIYIFVPAILWIAGDTVWHIFLRAERFSPVVFSLRDIPNMITIMLEITVLQIAVWGIAPEFCANNELFVAVIMMICAYCFGNIQWLLKKSITLLCLAIAILLSFLGIWKWVPAQWWVYIIVLGVMLFQTVASLYNYKRIPTSEVKEGMILSAGTVFTFSASQVKGLPNNASESMSARLNADQIHAIKRWEKSKHGKPDIVIVRKLPFAALVTLGFTLWMIIRITGM